MASKPSHADLSIPPISALISVQDERTQDERTPLLGLRETITHVITEEIITQGDLEEGRGKASKFSWKDFTLQCMFLLLSIIGLGLVAREFIKRVELDHDFREALKSALGSGISGAAATFLQVPLLMPLKTVMSYQHHSGTSMVQAFKNLYTDGGFTRYYRGFSAALFQGPLFRFVDAAAYSFIIEPLESNEHLRMLPQPVRTAIASFAAVGCRTVLTPISTIKTILQAQGNTGIAMLKDRIIDYGIGTLWHGGAVTAAATFVGHYPWFATYNYLDANLPPAHTTLAKLSRDAFVGLAASVVSDIASNSLRVIKTYRQASNSRIGYIDTIKAIIATNGLKELFGRGLKTRLLTSGFQGPMYSVLWKFFTEIWNEKFSNP